jgi:NhaP-type Na+/H+ or K+/H+ antiporter
VCLIGTPTTRVQRALMGWFGIRGIGSLYYLSYSLRHRPELEHSPLIAITVTVIAVSVVLHGITGQPLLHAYEKSLERVSPESRRSVRAVD